MNLKSTLIPALFILILVVAGCSWMERAQDLAGGGSATNSNAAAETFKTGVPECDKLFAKIEEKASDKNKEASMLERAAYSFLKDQVMKPIRDELANKNDADKKVIAAKCTEAYDKLITEEEKDAKKK